MSTIKRHPSGLGIRCGHITLPLISLGLLSAGSASAQVSWTGGADPDNNWSTAGNWTGGTPTGANVIFNDTDKSTDKDVVNSIVDADMTISSLSFENTGNGDANWQVVEIGAAETLTLDGSGISGGNVLFLGSETQLAGKTYTRAKITGGGSLVIDATDDNVQISRVSSNDLGTGELDLSGLNSFTADVANFYVGKGKRTYGKLVLAETNVITASKLAVGDSDGFDPGGVSLIQLGTSNTLNIDDIYIASRADESTDDWQRTSGKMEFLNDDESSSVTIRGAAGGTSRANLSIALGNAPSGGNTNSGLSGTVDFTGGTVDALLGQVTIGDHNAYTGSGATGTLSMDAGTIDATSVLLGQTEGRTQNNVPATGILNVEGGTFTAGTMSLAENNGSSLTNTQTAGAPHGILNVSGTGIVNVTGDVTMGTRTGGSIDVQATVNITGGTLTVGGDMTENAANVADANGVDVGSTVNLSGGTLDMTGGTIKVDTFTLESGTLKNLSQFNSGDTTGAALVKTGVGTLNIEGSNTFTGATIINEGTVALVTAGTNNIANSSAISVADGATFDLTGVVGGFTLAAGQTLGGDGTITGDLTFASGSSFAFSLTDTLDVTGTVSFDGFGITDLEGLDSLTIVGTYNLITGTVDATNLSNIGSGAAVDLGDGKSAYFEIGSLNLVVVPEPSAFALIMGGCALLLIGRRRRR